MVVREESGIPSFRKIAWIAGGIFDSPNIIFLLISWIGTVIRLSVLVIIPSGVCWNMAANATIGLFSMRASKILESPTPKFTFPDRISSYVAWGPPSISSTSKPSSL